MLSECCQHTTPAVAVLTARRKAVLALNFGSYVGHTYIDGAVLSWAIYLGNDGPTLLLFSEHEYMTLSGVCVVEELRVRGLCR